MDGTFLGEAGGYIIGSSLKADVDTYETSLIPESLQSTLAYLYAIENDYVTHSISPDGKWLALTGMNRDYNEKNEHTVTIIDMETGEIVKTYDIDNPFAEESMVAFYDNTRLMLFCEASHELGSAYIYLIDIEE
jgi:Tol biopolymer transport system component